MAVAFIEIFLVVVIKADQQSHKMYSCRLKCMPVLLSHSTRLLLSCLVRYELPTCINCMVVRFISNVRFLSVRLLATDTWQQAPSPTSLFSFSAYLLNIA